MHLNVLRPQTSLTLGSICSNSWPNLQALSMTGPVLWILHDDPPQVVAVLRRQKAILQNHLRWSVRSGGTGKGLGGCYDMLRPTSHTVTQLNQINQWSRILWGSPQTGPLRLLQARLATAAWCRVCGRCHGERWADSPPPRLDQNQNIYSRCSCSLKYGTYINNMCIYIYILYIYCEINTAAPTYSIW